MNLEQYSYIFFTIVVTFLISLILNFIFQRIRIAIDTFKGIQKFHKKETSRIGGLAVFISFLFSFCLLIFTNYIINTFFTVLTFSSIFIVSSGLIEDFTKKIPPITRLAMSYLSAFLLTFFIVFNKKIVILNMISALNNWISYLALLLFIIIIATFLATITNAFNIIDGYNGLASIIALIISISFLWISYLYRDISLEIYILTFISALLGFIFWNFPKGKIFLGDGGAYFIGFTLGGLGLYITFYLKVSPLYIISVFIYPLFEVIFSMYRKAILRKRSPFKPDGLHFHMLIYKRLLKKNKFLKILLIEGLKIERNPATSIVIILLYLPFVILSTFFHKNELVLIWLIIAFITVYLYLYFKLLNIKVT